MMALEKAIQNIISTVDVIDPLTEKPYKILKRV